MLESLDQADARHQQYAAFWQVLQSYNPPKRPGDPPVDAERCLSYYEALRLTSVDLQDKRTRLLRPHAMYYAASALNDFDRMAYALGEYCALAAIPAADLQPKSIASRHGPQAQDQRQEVAWPFETLAELLISQGRIAQARQVLDDGATAIQSLGFAFDQEDWYWQLED